MKKFLKINERLPLRLQTYITLLSYFQFELVSHLHNFRIGIPIGIPKEFLRNPQEFFGLLLKIRVDVCKGQEILEGYCVVFKWYSRKPTKWVKSKKLRHITYTHSPPIRNGDQS